MSALTAHLRLLSLVLSTAFGIVGLSTGINALARSNREKSAIRRVAPAGVSVSVDTHDVFASGVVTTVVCGLIALVSFTALVHALVARFRLRLAPKSADSDTRARTHLRTLPLFGAHVLAFLTVWLFATLVPFTDFVANRQARVSASIGGVPLPASAIQALQAKYGLTPVYHKLSYLRAATILQWLAFLFGATSAVLSYVYARQAGRALLGAGAGAYAQPEAGAAGGQGAAPADGEPEKKSLGDA